MMSLLSHVAKSLTARWTTCLGLALVLVLTMCSHPAWAAGSYIVAYSGGTATTTHTGYTDTAVAYSTNNFKHGVLYTSPNWGTAAGPNGTTVATSGSSTCTGAITATFTWQGGSGGGGYPGGSGYPSSGGTSEAPPTAVVIAETCEAKWSGSGGVVSGSASNGLGFTEVPNPGGGGGVSSGTKYTVKTNPGLSFTIPCSPSATVSGTGQVTPLAYGQGNASVQYSASAAPLEVVLSGGIGPKHDKSYLIGQRVGTNLLTGGLTPASCTWSVSGGAPFRDWTANQTTGYFDGAWQSNSSSNSFYFKKPEAGAVTVTCSSHLIVPTGAKPAAGLDVTQNRTCVVEAPTALFKSVALGSVSLAPGSRIQLGGLEMDAGIIWTGSALTPPSYTSLGVGGWNWVQITKGSDYQVNKTVSQSFVKNGQELLDNTYPYQPGPYTSHPGTAGSYAADGVDQKDGDRPGASLYAWSSGSPTNELDSVNALDSFGTWLMYLPPGTDSRYVPIRQINWFWHGAATKIFPGAWSMTSQPTDRGWGYEGDPYPPHPHWTARLLNDDFNNPNNWTPPVP